jgi:hypothetical protein
MVDYIGLADKVTKEYNLNICYREGNCRGWAYRKAPNGLTNFIICSKPKGRSSFFTFLHEAGHLVEQNCYGENGITRAEAETNATLWAIKKSKELGVSVRRKDIGKYKKYINMKYQRALKRGLKKKIKSKLYI